jgi:hypothetical protein
MKTIPFEQHFASTFKRLTKENYNFGCKHSKVDQESAPIYGSHDFLGQMPISSNKMLFNFFFMMTSIVKLGTQIQNINMRSSKPIIKNDA